MGMMDSIREYLKKDFEKNLNKPTLADMDDPKKQNEVKKYYSDLKDKISDKLVNIKDAITGKK